MSEKKMFQKTLDKTGDIKIKLSEYRITKKFNKLFKNLPQNEPDFDELEYSTTTVTLEITPVLTPQELVKNCIFYSIIFAFFLVFFIAFMFISGLSIVSRLFVICLDIMFIILGCKLVHNRKNFYTEKKIIWKQVILYFVPFLALLIGFIIFFLFDKIFNYIAYLNYTTQEPIAIALPVLMLVNFFLIYFGSTLNRFDEHFERFIERSILRDLTDEETRFIHKINKHVSYTSLTSFILLWIVLYHELNITIIIIALSLICCIVNGIYYYFSDLLLDLKIERNERKKQKKAKNSETDESIEVFEAVTQNDVNVSFEQKLRSFLSKFYRCFSYKYLFIAILGIIIFIFCFVIDLFHLRTIFTEFFLVLMEYPFLIGFFFFNILIFVIIPLLSRLTRPILKFIQNLYKKNIIKYLRTIFIYLIFFFVLKVLVFNFQDSGTEWIASLIISPILSLISMKLRSLKNIVE